MKNLVTSLFLFFVITSTGQAQGTMAITQDSIASEASTELTVHLVGLKSDDGKLMIALYDSAKNWLGNSVMGEMSDIVNGKATVTFRNVPHGTYAISSFHDEDSNGDLNSGVFGIPTEPYASSRGAKGMFGPPKWEDAKFILNAENAEETIKF